MNRDGDYKVYKHFAAGSTDTTPAPARHVASVLYVPVSSERETTRQCAMVVSEKERQRAGRFVSETERANFIQRRVFRRFCGAKALGDSRPLSEITFSETENGRPFLNVRPDIWFSFSSCCTGLLGAWSSSHGIGVDIEDRTRQVEPLEMAGHFFSNAEAEVVEHHTGADRMRAFFQFWCLKEAALKSVGEGLPLGLDVFEFNLSPKLQMVKTPAMEGGAERFTAHLFGGEAGCAALITRALA